MTDPEVLLTKYLDPEELVLFKRITGTGEVMTLLLPKFATPQNKCSAGA